LNYQGEFSTDRPIFDRFGNPSLRIWIGNLNCISSFLCQALFVVYQYLLLSSLFFNKKKNDLKGVIEGSYRKVIGWMH
jgi:hypothetical protein